MDFDYQFFKDIILVAMPTVAAFFTSKYVANAWQIKNEQISLKRKILSELDESFSQVLYHMKAFEAKIWSEYTVISEATYSEDGKIYNAITVIPPEEKDQPLQKFSKEIKQFRNEHLQLSEKSWKFQSTLSLYFGSGSFAKEYNAISSQIRPATIELEKLFLSKNVKTFEEQHRVFYVYVESIATEIEKFRHELIHAKLNLPTEERFSFLKRIFSMQKSNKNRVKKESS